jgi:carbonic anhydrase
VRFVDNVTTNNVIHTIERIRRESPIILDLENTGAIKIVGAIYNVDTGSVNFL